MKEIIAKIEDYMFDFLGLIMPGFIFLLLLSTPLLVYDYNKINETIIDKSMLLSILVNLSKYTDIIVNHSNQFTVIVIILLSYIIGHLIKVLSIIQYEFLKVIFDDFICKFISQIKNLIKSFIKWCVYLVFSPTNITLLFLVSLIRKIYAPFLNLYKKIFKFSSPSYFKENDILKDDCIEQINIKFNTQFPLKWYSLYKFGTVIQNQENIKSTSFLFLAKYNFYRSLAFVFSIISIYYYLFFDVMNQYLDKSILSLQSIIISTLALLWFTFHYKYKRYWTLCGNEVLVSLFYFLKK